MKTIRLLIVTILLLALAGCMSGQEMAEGLGGILEDGAAAMVTADAQDPAAQVEATIVADPLPGGEGTDALPSPLPGGEGTEDPAGGLKSRCHGECTGFACVPPV